MRRRGGRHADTGRNSKPAAGRDEIIVDLIKSSAESHFLRDIDIDTAFTNFHRNATEPIVPQRSLLVRARRRVRAMRQVLIADWFVRIRQPQLAIPLSAALIATLATLVLAVLKPTSNTPHPPGHRNTPQAVGSQPAKGNAGNSPAGNPVILDVGGTSSRNFPPDSPSAGSEATTVLPSLRLTGGDKTAGSQLAVAVKIGDRRDPIVGLNVKVGLSGDKKVQAGLGVSVDTSSVTCQLQSTFRNIPIIAGLLSQVGQPVLIRITVGTQGPMTVKLSPTGIPQQPLACSILNLGSGAGAIGGSSEPVPLPGQP